MRMLKLSSYLFSFFFALEVATAGLPQSLSGEALPSLAPMLETTMPSVVNIATSGTVVERSPLFKDPFFKHFLIHLKCSVNVAARVLVLGSS